MKKFILSLCAVFALAFTVACDMETPASADQVQKHQQEAMMKEATTQTGMPAIKNFRERKLAKLILEMRDQEGLTTYTYVQNEHTGKFKFLGESVGFAIPYATQYTSPQKIERAEHQIGYAILPQADPNGLYSPGAAEGSWVIMKDPNSDKVAPVYIEQRVLVSPFKLRSSMVED